LIYRQLNLSAESLINWMNRYAEESGGGGLRASFAVCLCIGNTRRKRKKRKEEKRK
jgi:hypothetical protein